MQETMKRVAAGALGLLMAGSTLLAPSFAAADLASFANMKPSDTVIVVGANAATADVVGAINVGGALAQHGASATVTGTTSGSSTVEGGVKVESIGQKLYLATNMNTSLTRRITSSDMPVALADGTVTDNETTEIKYTQQITLGANQVIYDKPSADITTPQLNLNLPISGGPIVSMKVVFDRAVAYANLAGKTIKIFGKEYTFASAIADLQTTRLVLYGGGEALSVNAGGATKTVVLDKSDVTIQMTSWTSANEAVLSINGASSTYAQGAYITVPGHESKIYVKKVVVTKTPSAQGGAGESAYAELFAGSDKLVFASSQVLTGKNEDTINGATSAVTTSSISVSYAPTEEGYVAKGQTWKEPVFKAVKFAFSSVTPELGANTRQKIEVKQDGTTAASLSFPSATGDVTMPLAFHNSTSNYQSDKSGYLVAMTENTQIPRNSYFVIGTPDTGSRVFQITSFNTGTTSNTTTMKDLGTGTSTTYTYNQANPDQNVLYVQGVPFKYNVSFVPTAPSTSLLMVDMNGDGTIGSAVRQAIYTKEGNARINTTAVDGGTGAVSVIVREDPSNRVSTFTNDGDINVTAVYTAGSENRYEIFGSTGAAVMLTGTFVDGNNALLQSGSTEEYTAYTKWGTFVKATGDSSGVTRVELSTPSEPVIANVYVLQESASVPVAGTTTTTGSGAVVQPSLAGGISKLDSAVGSADKAEKNLILVGGPAVNTLVAELAAANKTDDLTTWRSTLVGKYVIQSVENAFATGKTAIVVAGYEAAQTQAASLKLATEALTGAKVTSA